MTGKVVMSHSIFISNKHRRGFERVVQYEMKKAYLYYITLSIKKQGVIFYEG